MAVYTDEGSGGGSNFTQGSGFQYLTSLTDYLVLGSSSAQTSSVDGGALKLAMVGSSSRKLGGSVEGAAGGCFWEAGNGTIVSFFGIISSGSAGYAGTASAHPFRIRTSNTDRVAVETNGVTNFAFRRCDAKGADVASASTLTLGLDGNSFDITGTTTINHITTANWQAGSRITLQFDASVTVTHNAGSPPGGTVPILLAGAANMSATAGDTLTLWYDGAAFREVGRAVI